MLSAEENKDYWKTVEEDLEPIRKVFKPPGDCMNTNKEENYKMREKIKKYEIHRECGKRN